MSIRNQREGFIPEGHRRRLDLSLQQTIGSYSVQLRSIKSANHLPNVSLSFSESGPLHSFNLDQYDQLIEFLRSTRHELGYFLDSGYVRLTDLSDEDDDERLTPNE